MEATLEFLRSGSGRRRNRSWPDELKARIVAETLMPGATVKGVARRHGLAAHHVSSWRTLARKGRLVLPAPEDPVEFATLMVSPAEKVADVGVGEDRARPEIIAGDLVIRLEAGAAAERIASVVRALAASA